MTNPLAVRRQAEQMEDHGFTRPLGKISIDDLQTYAGELNARPVSQVSGWYWHVSVKADTGQRFLDRTDAAIWAWKQKKAEERRNGAVAIGAIRR